MEILMSFLRRSPSHVSRYIIPQPCSNPACTQNIVKLFYCVVLVLCLTACESTVQPATSQPDQSAAWQAWQSSPHSDTYGLGKGPNTYCAQCHAPRNWDPLAVIDPPPNCVSCKFDFETAPRLAVGNRLIPESEWLNIGCEICHQMIAGVANPDVAWLDPVTGTYEPVSSDVTVCEKCHIDTKTLRHARSINSTHSAFQCTDCHDAHSTAASCTAANCHPDTFNPEIPVPGHDTNHQSVACVACHDASNFEIGPQDDGIYITWRTTELLGREITTAYLSHNLQLSVDCDRCHFANNPWQLNPAIEAATP